MRTACPKTVLLAGLLFCCLSAFSCRGKGTGNASSAGDKKFNPTHAAIDYQMLQAELKLANTDKPYLAIDFARKRLTIMLKGMLVWSYPIDVSQDDAAEIADFIERFRGGSQLVRPISETHLFSGQTKTPDSILAIVSEATKFKPELLQRELPEHFQLLWGENVIIDIRTDIKGKATNNFKNTILEIRHALQTPFGKSQINIKMSSDRALTLFRVAQPGLPTIIFPPKS